MSHHTSRLRLILAGVAAVLLAAPTLARQVTMATLLDVDGTIANGRVEIERLYGDGRARDHNPLPPL